MRRVASALLIATFALGVVACDDDAGPAEKTGETIDKAAEKTGEAIKEGAEKTGEATEKAGEAVKDAAK